MYLLRCKAHTGKKCTLTGNFSVPGTKSVSVIYSVIYGLWRTQHGITGISGKLNACGLKGKEAPTEKSLKSYSFREWIFLDLGASFTALLVIAKALFGSQSCQQGARRDIITLSNRLQTATLCACQHTRLPGQHHHPKGGAGALALRLEAARKCTSLELP